MDEIKHPVIGLITDFGSKGSHYVASLKGVILEINPSITIIDISHEITPFSVVEASYVLEATYKYFPEGTIFIIVVDPGVGSQREILAIVTESNYFFIGPNNGIFTNILNLEKIKSCVKIENENYFRKPVSNTFHGRDIMAPVAAHLSMGLPINDLGMPFEEEKIITTSIKSKIIEDETLIPGFIQYIDNFGNITTNIKLTRENIMLEKKIKLREGQEIKVKVKDKIITGQFFSHFNAVPKNSILFLKGSTGYLEISINQGNAAKEFDLKVSDEILIMV